MLFNMQDVFELFEIQNIMGDILWNNVAINIIFNIRNLLSSSNVVSNINALKGYVEI